MNPLGGALVRALRSLGLDREVARASAVIAWPEASRSTLGPAARGVVAARMDGDTLVVLVPSSTHAAEIRLREREILGALEALAPGSGVKRIRCAPTGGSPA